MPISLGDRRLVLGGALTASTLLFYALYPVNHSSGVEIVPREERRPLIPVVPPPELPVPPAAPAPTPSAEGLRLHGVTATGAIIGFAGGAQRLVALGREVLPGLKLQEVRQHHALLASAAGVTQLGFNGPAEAADAGAAAPGPQVGPPRPATAPARREETLQYRFGLAPVRVDGRIAGFAIRPGAQMPALERAGLRAGDVLVGVNGQTFDSDEKVMELANEIAGSFAAEFEFERNGRRMRASLPVNSRS